MDSGSISADSVCTEVPVMIIVMFVLYGFVMNTVPQ